MVYNLLENVTRIKTSTATKNYYIIPINMNNGFTIFFLI